MKLFIAAGLAGLTLASTAAAQPDKPSCFWTRDLRNHTVGTDGHTLYFNVAGRSVYRATTTGNCLAAVTSSDPIVLVDRGGNGQICNKLDINLSVRGTRCIVSDLNQLTPAEAAALPPKLKP
jgi:hypothetical protein